MTSSRQLGLLWGGVAILLVAVSPFGEQLAARSGACPMKAVTGIACPTCGATRAALALARLDVVAAVRLNPLVTAGWALLVVGGLAALAWTLAGRCLPRPPRLPWGVRLGAVAAVLANWIYVNWIGL